MAATLELANDLPAPQAFDLVRAARSVGFRHVNVMRGDEGLEFLGRSFDPYRRSDTLELLLQGETWSLDWVDSSERQAYGSVRRVRGDVERAINDYRHPPCSVLIAATSEGHFFDMIDAALATLRGRPCPKGAASFGFYASPPSLNSIVGDVTPPGVQGDRELTIHMPAAPPAPQPTPSVREERTVKVDGVTERWRIEWRDKPEPVCTDGWYCACVGVEHGESGEAVLIRSRAGVADEVFHLESIYDLQDDGPPRLGSRESVLPGWPYEDADSSAPDSDETRAAIRARPRVTVMDLRDYDHDGRATEFVLPIGGVGCVWHHYVVVGTSRREPNLHVFSEAGHPLELSYAAWNVLRSPKGRGRYVESPCGNHGSETQIEVDIWTDPNGIHTKYRELTCEEVLRRDGAIK